MGLEKQRVADEQGSTRLAPVDNVPVSVHDLAVEARGVVSRLVGRHEDEIGALRTENLQLRSQLAVQRAVAPPSAGDASRPKDALLNPDVDSGGEDGAAEVWSSLIRQAATSEPPVPSDAALAEVEPVWSSARAANGLSFATDAPQFLKVTIMSAVGLRDADHMVGAGLSDPYCVCEIAGRHGSRCVTPVINDTLNPVWAYCGLLDWEPGESIVFSVFDKDIGKKDDLLGTATLSSEVFQAEGFDGKLRLTGVGAEESILTVKVSILGGELRDADEAECEMLRRDCLEAWCGESHRFTVTVIPAMSEAFDDGIIKDPRVGGVWGMEQGRFARCVLHPICFKRTFWNVFGCALVAYDTFMIPYQEAFDSEGETSTLGFMAVIAFFWTLDLLASFFVGFYRDGLVEMRFRMIARNYMKSWFVIDFTVLTIDWTFIVLTMGSSASMLRVIRSIRAVRSVRAVSLLRVSKIQRFIDLFLQGTWSETMMAAGQVAYSIMIILWFNHCIACAWYVIGSQAEERTWVKKSELGEQNTAYAYFTSLHWALTQFTPASSEIQPTNAYERAFTILIDLLGLVGFSTFVSSITSRMTHMRSMNKERLNQDADLRHFFMENGVSLELAKCVIEYAQSQRLLQQRRLHEQDLPTLVQLPRNLRHRLREEVYLPVISAHPLFACLSANDDDCLFSLCRDGLMQIAARAGEEVFTTGAQAKSMFFLTCGVMVYHRGEWDRPLSTGDWACEAALWIERWVHRGSLAAEGWTELVKLSGDAFRKFLVDGARSKALGNFLRRYAILFLGEGCVETEAPMRWTDVWGSRESLQALVRRGLSEAAPELSIPVKESLVSHTASGGTSLEVR